MLSTVQKNKWETLPSRILNSNRIDPDSRLSLLHFSYQLKVQCFIRVVSFSFFSFNSNKLHTNFLKICTLKIMWVCDTLIWWFWGNFFYSRSFRHSLHTNHLSIHIMCKPDIHILSLISPPGVWVLNEIVRKSRREEMKQRSRIKYEFMKGGSKIGCICYSSNSAVVI